MSINEIPIWARVLCYALLLTFAITIVATTAATLTPILNRVLKPLFKQAIGKVKKANSETNKRFIYLLLYLHIF